MKTVYVRQTREGNLIAIYGTLKRCHDDIKNLGRCFQSYTEFKRWFDRNAMYDLQEVGVIRKWGIK